MSIQYNLVGERFGKLMVASFSHSTTGKVKAKMWNCLCDCGNNVIQSTAALKIGKTKSCGCLRKDGSHSVTHGQASGGVITSEYRAWVGMLGRCYNANTTRFENHGGRGIRVCKRWRKFENFFADMGKKPTPDHSLDRHPNNDGNYTPKNCRWATTEQQANNRRSSRFIEYNSEIKTLSQWTRLFGLSSAHTLSDYIERNGVEKAMIHFYKKINP